MKYKVGDKVKVKNCDDLKNEYELDCFGFINTPRCAFNHGMEKYCGKVVTIKETYSFGYKINEDNGRWTWTDEMFANNYIDLLDAYRYLLYDSNRILLPAEHGLTSERKEENMGENMKVKKQKDKDYHDRIKKITEKIDFYRRKSGFIRIDEVVPGKVLDVEMEPKNPYGANFKCKMVCDERDEYSIEKALYLAIAKQLYASTYTPEGIERKADELRYKKEYVKKVNAALKMLKLQKELKVEELLHEQVLEERKQKRWERKQKQMDKRTAKKKELEEKEAERQIEIQKEAYIRAMKEVEENKKYEDGLETSIRIN